jgi:hypothetical protein
VLTEQHAVAERVKTVSFNYLASLSEASSSLSYLHRQLELDVLRAGQPGEHEGRAIGALHQCPGGLREMLKIVCGAVCGSWRALEADVLGSAGGVGDDDVAAVAADCLELQTSALVLCVAVFGAEPGSNIQEAAFIVKEEMIK